MLIRWIAREGKELKGYCPLPHCAKPNFSYDVDKGVARCWSCQSAWSGKQLKKLYGEGLFETQALIALSAFKPNTPKGRVLERGDLVWWHWDGRVRATLLERGWSPSLQVWWHARQGRVYFPLVTLDHQEPFPANLEGACIHRALNPLRRGWIIRGRRDNCYYAGSRLQRGTRHVVLFEGVHDVVYTQLLFPNIAILGTSVGMPLQAHLRGLGVERVTLWMDSDTPGRQAATKLTRELRGAFKVGVVETTQDPKHYSPQEANRIIREFFVKG